MLSGLRAPTSGSVTFEGRDITQVKAHEFSAMGISHVPEGRRIFPVMTVEENLEMGAFARRGSLGDDLDEIYTQFPILEGPSQTAGLEPLGWRTADVGDRPRVDVETSVAPSR